MDLEGNVALITGGAQGIGKVTALLLARKGADVAVSDINMEGASETAREIEELGRRALAVEGDVSNPADAESIIAKTVEQVGGIDILVNNAGITRDRLLLRMTEEDWDAVLNVNLKGTFNCTKAVLPAMMEQKSGNIIGITSIAAKRKAPPGEICHSITKAGIELPEDTRMCFQPLIAALIDVARRSMAALECTSVTATNISLGREVS